MQGNQSVVRDFHTFYFIESHLKGINNLEVVVDSSQKCLKPLRKLNEKEFKNKEKQDFIVSVYALDFSLEILQKKKEFKMINGVPCISVKICQKIDKQKFEAHVNFNAKHDTFCPNINFEPIKKVFKKTVAPPDQIPLSVLEMMQLFKDGLIVKERKKENDPTYVEYIKYGYSLIIKMQSIELALFLMLYIDILNGNDLVLIKGIFDLFKIEKLIRPLKPSILSQSHEKLQLLYNDQVNIFEKIKKIPNCKFESYLIKFYTVYLHAHYIVENYETCESILKDLRDHNPFDNLILPKLYLSEYAQFYRNIPISVDLQNSLMGKFIYTSTTYENLKTSFTLISEYIKKDFLNMLLIICNNYDKIYQICFTSKKPLKINDYIAQTPNDDLPKIQYQLDFIVQKKLEHNFKTIDFNINMWDIYLSIPNNVEFYNYIKSKLIIASLCYNDVIYALKYIIKFNNKNFVEMLDLIVLNYDKLRYICMKEKKPLIITEFIAQNLNDNIEKIKEDLSFIVTEKLKDQFEAIYFHISIWNYYPLNNYQFEFLNFLELKLYEAAINFKDIYDCVEYSSNFRQKSFSSLLDVIIQNFDKIMHLTRKENQSIDIQKFITQKPGADDLSKIFELIKIIIGKERMAPYAALKFNENIWMPYSNSSNIDSLKFIRKILNECRIMEPYLNEDKLLLAKKIHDEGFIEIKQGVLVDNKLLQFLGEEEAFYVDKQINENKNQINLNSTEINKLIQENNILKSQVNTLEGQVKSLINENSNLKSQISSCRSEINSLNSSVNNLSSDYRDLKSRIRNLEFRP